MKISKVTFNNRKKTFEIRAGAKSFSFPYAKAKPAPTPSAPVVRAYIDQELGYEAFSYVLKNGDEGTVHIDHVLEYNRDPGFMWELFMYKLTLEVKKRLAASNFSKRELVRKLHTSPTQFYRLLDEEKTSKSPFQLFEILRTLDCDINLVVAKGRDRGIIEWNSSVNAKASAIAHN